MDWNTLVAVSGTLIGAVLGAAGSIWLAKIQHSNNTKNWEKDKKLQEYVRVLSSYGALYMQLSDFLYLRRASRSDIHDQLTNAHQSTMMLVAPTTVLAEYNSLYALFSDFMSPLALEPTDKDKQAWQGFMDSYRLQRRKLVQEMRADLELPGVSFKDTHLPDETANIANP
ncbi:hypothetical protein [Glutamicibacter protophormiae]|uniref:hypothetical protein n=1 Tax=Glutamicibacter protophormiae TaxID=37930 RepID=UPI0019560FB4|nr:hypothetical protein [Glutamicibacter protophormiae]QRQ79800.1 hypothetical protein JQN66_06205 [Glutamicibacter protophormiae]